jgi:hypothetical protein
MFCIAVLVSVPSVLAQADKLIGVWNITEAEIIPTPDQNQKPTVIKNPQPGIVIFTKNHFSWVHVPRGSNYDLPENPTLANFAADFEQLTAFSGTYDVKGSAIEANIIVSKTPNPMGEGNTLYFEYKFEGDNLVLILRQWKGKDLELKMTRLE